MLKISVSMDMSVLEFYGYIGYIGGYFYMNIDISKINKNISGGLFANKEKKKELMVIVEIACL